MRLMCLHLGLLHLGLLHLLLWTLVSASGECPAHWLLFRDRCIAAFPVWAEWSAAEALCSQSGAHLVSLRSSDDVEFVGKMTIKLGVPVWTGRSDVLQSGSWEKNSDPVCLGIESEGGEVKSAPCDEIRFYICSRQTRSEDQNIDEEAESSSGLSPGQSLPAVMWGQSHLVAEEILRSSSFLLHLRSGSITQSCYDRFRQQEALYMGLVYKILEGFLVPDSDPEVGCLLLDTKELYRTRSSKQDPVTAPQWLRFALQSFHFVAVDDPLYLLVALSARSFLNSFVLESVPLPGFMQSPESERLYQRWREETEAELTLTHRFKDVIEKHQNESDIYKTINVFREHLRNQKSLHRHIECEE